MQFIIYQETVMIIFYFNAFNLKSLGSYYEMIYSYPIFYRDAQGAVLQVSLLFLFVKSFPLGRMS